MLPILLLVASVPVLDSIAPPHAATAGGAAIRLRGAGFVEGSHAAIGGDAGMIDLPCRFRSEALLECEAPAISAGPRDVLVTNPDGSSALLREAIVYFELRSVRASRGPAEGGARVLLAGEFFPRTTRILFGGAPAACRWRNASEIRCITPPGPASQRVHVDAIPAERGQTASRLTRAYFYEGPQWTPPGVARAPLKRILPQPLTLAATPGAKRPPEEPAPDPPPPSTSSPRVLLYEFESVFAPPPEVAPPPTESDRR